MFNLFIIIILNIMRYDLKMCWSNAMFIIICAPSIFDIYVYK